MRIFSLLFLSIVASLGATAPAQAAPIWSGAPLVAAQFNRGFAIHGVAGDKELLFALVPSAAPNQAPSVLVARRDNGNEIGTLVAPTGGWGVPLSMKISEFQDLVGNGTRGQAVILDNRVPPALAGTQPAKIYRYKYKWRALTGLTSQVISEHSLPINTVAPGAGLPNGFIYPGSIALLPDNKVAVTDNITGAIWVSGADLNTWNLMAIDPRWAGTFGGPVNGVGLAQNGTVQPYTLQVPAPPGSPPGLGLYPGAHSITYTNLTDEVAFAVTLPGGIYAMPRSVLLDTVTPPFAKSGDPSLGTWGSVRVLVAPTAGLGDLTDGVDYDRFHPASEWVYWQRAPADTAGGGFNTLRRVSLITGQVQDVASNNTIYSWANEISALPPRVNGSPLTTMCSSVGQEYNNPDVNVLLGGVSQYFSPSRMPIVIVNQ